MTLLSLSWQIFRPLAIACLVAILTLTGGLACFFVDRDGGFRGTAEDVLRHLFYGSLFLLWPVVFAMLLPAVLLALGFFVDRRLHLTAYAVARYGARRIAATAYVFMAIEALLIRMAISGPWQNPWSIPLSFALSILPGLLLLAWWRLRMVAASARLA